MTGYRHAPSRPSTDEEIKIFVTENTESDTFCMEEYSKNTPLSSEIIVTLKIEKVYT